MSTTVANENQAIESLEPEVIKPELAKAIDMLTARRAAEEQFDADKYASYFKAMTLAMKEGLVQSMAPALPLLLRLKGVPYSLHRHFPMEPLFDLVMPRSFCFKCGRQVSKSTTLGAQGVIQSAVSPYFSSLYVCPRFEQTRKFSNNYVKPFLTDSPIGSALLDPAREQSVLQRSYINGSTQHFSYAFLDCERTRGIAADGVTLDECVRKNVAILTPSGYHNLEHCRVGDPIVAFDEPGRLVQDTITKIAPKGRRPVWRVTLENGATIECTDNEKLRTEHGWTYLQEVIDACTERRFGVKAPAAYTICKATGARDALGRRQHAVVGRKERQIPHNPRCAAGGLLPTQGGETSRVCVDDPSDSTQSRVGDRELRFFNGDLPSLRVYSAPVLPPRPKSQEARKVRQLELAKATDMGGTSVLVHGRRGPIRPELAMVQHPRLSQEGSRDACSDACKAGHRCQKPPCEQGREALLRCRLEPRVRAEVHREDSTVCTGVHELQAGHQDQAVLDVSSLRNGDGTHWSEQDLRIPGVPTSAAPGVIAGLRCDTPGREEPEGPRSLLRGSGSLSDQKPRIPRRVPKDAPGRGERLPPRTQCEDPRSQTRGAINVSDLRGPDASNESQQGVCPDLHQAGVQTREAQVGVSETESQSQSIQGSPIVALEYIGEDDVFDIETEKYHTLFAGGIAVHNCQDIDSSFIPIINETLSASDWDRRQYAGTPKTFDNTLEGLWEESSQAEWVIPCDCGYWNIACTENDLLTMIQREGLSCAKCHKLVDSTRGHWEHRYADRINSFVGYHVPQPIMPMHYDVNPMTGTKDKWDSLFKAKNEMDKSTFYNEKLGESCDIRSSLLTRTDLQKASTLPHNNELRAAVKLAPKYLSRVLGIDWGGGGMKGTSYTTIAVLGFKPNGHIDVLYGERLSRCVDASEEVGAILHYMQAFRCDMLAHDFNGSGSVKEVLLLQAGLNPACLFPAVYMRATSKNMVTYKAAEQGIAGRPYYIVDKARSLVLLCELIKHGAFSFPQFKSWESLSDDFLALVEDKHHVPRAGDVFLIDRKSTKSDDFVHSVNFAALAYWHANQKYPDLSRLIGIKLTNAQAKALS